MSADDGVRESCESKLALRHGAYLPMTESDEDYLVVCLQGNPIQPLDSLNRLALYF